MKKTKLLIPILGLTSVVGVVTPLITSCGKQDETVTIHFYATGDGGVSFETMEAKVGDKWSDLQLPEAQAATGYAFVGWFNGNYAMKNDSIITSNMNISARFVEISDKPYAIGSDQQEFEFHGQGVGDTFVLDKIPNTPIVVIPTAIRHSWNTYEKISIKGIKLSDENKAVQSIYVSKNVIDTSEFTSSQSLVNIFVDPLNPVYTSRSAAGKECSCLIKKQTEESPATVCLGSHNSVIPTDLQIKVISESAFYNFYGETIVLPETLEEIRQGAFYKSYIKNITIPKNVKIIGMCAFASCAYLEEVMMMGEAPTTDQSPKLTIQTAAFLDCVSLKTLNLAKNTVSIEGLGSFAGCKSLESVSIPAATENISAEAFRGCTNLSSIVVDGKNEKFTSANSNCILQKMGTDQWELIVGCKATTIPAICTSIGDYAFTDCALTQVTIPNKVASIGSYAFAGVKLESIVIPKNVKVIKEHAFENAEDLMSLTLEEGIEEINDCAFKGCIRLESVTIPSTLTTPIKRHEIGMFSGCSSLSNVTVKSKDLLDCAFTNCVSLKTVTLTDAVHNICDHAFANCYGLESIVIPKNMEEIRQNAFVNCTSLSSITFADPNSSCKIGTNAFNNCSSLREIAIPKLATLWNYVFDGCMLKDKTISYCGTNAEFKERVWLPNWYKNSSETKKIVEKVICLNETDPSKRVVIIE